MAEDGSTFIFEDAKRYLDGQQIERIRDKQIHEARKRVEVLPRLEPLPQLKNRTVVLVDDGIAMGSTVRAAIKLCRNAGVARLVVGVPVSRSRVAEEIVGAVDALVVLEKPPSFGQSHRCTGTGMMSSTRRS